MRIKIIITFLLLVSIPVLTSAAETVEVVSAEAAATAADDTAPAGTETSSTEVEVVSLTEQAAINSGPMSAQYLMQLIFGLLIVVVCIVVLAWFAKRVNRLQSSTGGMLTVLGGISMGSRERIVLLQVGDEQLLLGVAPGRINTLHVLDIPVSESNASSQHDIAGSFSEKLKSIITEGGK